mmetsp:Transcript_20502/g.22985  ORF Transcript_20502/g.22985 Transcript_20502/m.22985 type:complete len:82 (+) Transcript_20502:131-376(+)
MVPPPLLIAACAITGVIGTAIVVGAGQILSRRRGRRANEVEQNDPAIPSAFFMDDESVHSLGGNSVDSINESSVFYNSKHW